MGGGNKALLATVALAVTGCTADDGKLNVRAIADPLAAASKRGSPMIVEARAALALGNVGTALEAFRKALREQPDSIEALAGIAACYERMGRYDLSRVNYEAALAIAPNNPILLNSFAASLQLQGRTAEANALRAEAQQVEAAEVAAAVQTARLAIAAETAPTPAVASPVIPRVQVATPAPAPKVAIADPPKPVPQPEPQVIHTEVVGNTEWTIEIPTTTSAAAAVVAMPLPPLGPIEADEALAPALPALVEPAPKAVAVAQPAPQKVAPIAAVAVGDVHDVLVEAAAVSLAKPVPKAPVPKAPIRSEPLVLAEVQPRLERLTTGEVALLTRGGPAWRTEVVAQSKHSVTARFVPLTGAMASIQTARFVPLKTHMAANRPNIRLLNAARHQGLAASTRNLLTDRGWRKIAIGDAAQVRARSIVLYPANRQALGRRVAAQFGFATAMNRDSDEVLVLLGRDAASLSFRRARG
jgi:hypothetical protein